MLSPLLIRNGKKKRMEILTEKWFENKIVEVASCSCGSYMSYIALKVKNCKGCGRSPLAFDLKINIIV